MTVIDRLATADRRTRLTEYLTRSVLDGEEFVCRNAPVCKHSACQPGVSYYEGQLSYLGAGYDVVDHGRPLRVLVVPMEVGRPPEHVTMELRDKQVQMRIPQLFKQRNPHMRGVTLALRLAFGLPLGDDRAGEFLDTPDGRVHVLDAYAMANLLLCSAVAEGKTTSRATPAMRRNCAAHLAATIEILQPTLVISQGKTLVEPLMTLFEQQRQHAEHVWRASVRGASFVWVPLHHPTHNWDWLGRPYLKTTVVPAIETARSLALNES
jgi:hypothetical protein